MADKKIKNKSVLKKVFSYIGKYKYYLILSMLFAAVTVGLTLYAPILVGHAIDCIVGKDNVDFDLMKSILIKVAIIVIATAIIQWLMNVCNNKITYNVSRDLRKKAFEKIEVLPFSYIDTHSKGDIVSRVITDVDQLSDGLLMGFTQFFTGVITIIGTLAFMLSVNVFITIVVVIVTPLSFFIARFIAKKTFNMFSLQTKTRGEQTAFIDEMISNQKVADAYSMDDENKKRFDEINDDLAKYSLKATFFSSITTPATRFVNSIVYAAVALFGAIMAVKGNITVGILSCFLSYANQYTKPFNEISSVVTELQNAMACACRVFELIEETPQIPDSTDAKELSNVKGDIDISDLYFSYNPEKELLKDVNVSVTSGKTVAIVGPTGCGKTTLLRILGGFETPDSGKIIFDGQDITNLAPNKRQLNTVFQRYALFPHMTIEENIAFGLKIKGKSKSYIDDKIKYALKLVNLDGYGHRMPDSLSGGQQQRIAIARAIVNEPKVLLLDEPLGALDLKLRQDMQYELIRLKNELGITFIYVTHDQEEALTMSDTVVVMNGGKVQQIGTPEDIYNEPKNAFVADFIGDSNIVDGVMHKDFLVSFSGVDFPCVDRGFAREQSVQVVVRPEDIEVVSPVEGQLVGVVNDVIFKGVHFEMHVECEGREWLIHSTRACTPGETIGMRIGPNEIHIMARSEG